MKENKLNNKCGLNTKKETGVEKQFKSIPTWANEAYLYTIAKRMGI